MFTGQSTERKVIIARAFEWMDLEAGNYGGPLGRALFDDFMPSPIAIESELEALETATDEELASWYPVALAREVERTYAVIIISPMGYSTFDAERSGDGAARDGFRAIVAALDDGADATSPQVRALHRTYARDVWQAWFRTRSADQTPEIVAIPARLPQQTYQEVKRVNQSLADGPDGSNWSAVVGKFALQHNLSGALHNVRIDGALIPEWWDRPTDNESLLAELRQTGLHGIATLGIATAFLVKSKAGHVDIEIDDLINRISITPKSHRERIEARILVWRILTILGAANIIGQSRLDIWDSVTRKKVQLDSQDPLITVRAMKPRGTQESFDPGVPPMGVTIRAGPLLARWKNDRSVLQDFGDLLAGTGIPIGRPSGAWARAIGLALQQCWREQAARAQYGRADDEHRPTVKFRLFSRRELLELFKPQPSVREVLDGRNPRRNKTFSKLNVSSPRSMRKSPSIPDSQIAMRRLGMSIRHMRLMRPSSMERTFFCVDSVRCFRLRR